ncbi:hypothetical protein ABZ746_22295 [Streptomyces sp. NPDC020096]
MAESLGYVVVVIAAPVLLMRLGGSGRRTTAALAVWGTFMPVGLALGAFADGALLRGAGPGAAEPGADYRQTGGGVRRLVQPTALALGFATISGAIVAFVAMFPSYLHERLGLPVADTGTLTGAVSFVGVAGGFASSWLLCRGANIAMVFTAGLLMPLGAFVAFAGVGGIGTANGLVAQLGSVGSLAGPPVVGLAVGAAGGAVLLAGGPAGVEGVQGARTVDRRAVQHAVAPVLA